MEGLDKKKIGVEIKIRRMRNNMMQTELAAFLGISQTHLSNVESGRVMLGIKLLLKLKDCFGCTLDEMVDPEGYKKMLEQKRQIRKYKMVRYDE